MWVSGTCGSATPDRFIVAFTKSSNVFSYYILMAVRLNQGRQSCAMLHRNLRGGGAKNLGSTINSMTPNVNVKTTIILVSWLVVCFWSVDYQEIIKIIATI